MNCRTFSQNSRTRGKSHHHIRALQTVINDGKTHTQTDRTYLINETLEQKDKNNTTATTHTRLTGAARLINEDPKRQQDVDEKQHLVVRAYMTCASSPAERLVVRFHG